MTLSSEIFDYLDTLSPAALALDWDNSGLQVGSRNARLSGKFWWR